ncbi:hypothetical protein FFI11_013540 [Oerskovia sp. KBS0722]|nr:hypothetical protein FFI11_013540 [Oerskovia sp. KBS0722]
MHGSHGRVSERAHQRVRALAATALADEGIDLHSTDPAQVQAAAARLGTQVHQQMTSDPRPPTMKVLRSWVSAIEHLTGGAPVGESDRSTGLQQTRSDA